MRGMKVSPLDFVVRREDKASFDAVLRWCLHSTEGNRDIWNALRSKYPKPDLRDPAFIADTLEAVGTAFGTSGGIGGPNCWSGDYLGGRTPRFWCEPRNTPYIPLSQRQWLSGIPLCEAVSRILWKELA
jgi:hypothetical protein